MRILNWKNKAEQEIIRKKLFNRRETLKVSEDIAGKIIRDVAGKGDAAVAKYTERFDRIKLKPGEFRVKKSEINAAYRKISRECLSALQKARNNLIKFHKGQAGKSLETKNAEGATLGMRIQAIARVGAYVPSGKAAYPSSVLMNVVPAKIAGTEKIILCTPARPDKSVPPEILVAADMSGADGIFRIGGAQAIAAMAYGTETIPAVDLIAGPGGSHVTAAKRLVFGKVGIDSLAGPSEILIIADRTSDPAVIVADLFAQAEHDVDASAFLVTTSKELAGEVCARMRRFLSQVKGYRNNIPAESLRRNGLIILVPDIDSAVALSDEIAPEHLEIMSAHPEKTGKKIKNAGAIFMGTASAVALGDYIAGTNHVLPTGGSARFSSGLGVENFIKRIQTIRYSSSALAKTAGTVQCLAETEGLLGHSLSIRVRMHILGMEKAKK